MQTLKLVGVPGSGKTRTMLGHFENEMRAGVRPDRISFLTFTRAARDEALSRAQVKDLPYVRTIHSICYRQLGLKQNDIARPKDIQFFGRAMGVKLSGRVITPWADFNDDLSDDAEYVPPTAADTLLQLNHVGRHRRSTLKECLLGAPADIDFHFAKWFTIAYKEWKRKEGLRDYTDLLTEYLSHGDPLPCDVIFVDEAQDLSRLQWDVIHALARNCKRMYVAGDDDQAIYSWAGASAHAFINERADETKILARSHRVPREVWKVADGIASRISNRIAKDVVPRAEDGEVSEIMEISDEDLQSSSLILFRHHFRSRPLARRLQELAVPYLGDSSPLSLPRVIDALRGWDDVCTRATTESSRAWSLVNASSTEYLKPGAAAAVNKMKDKEQVLWDKIFLRKPVPSGFADYLSKLPGVNYLDRCVSRHGINRVVEPTTRLMSIHQAKGREADTVVLDTELARKSYESSLETPDEEHRVFYVAVTRARERLILLANSSPRAYNISL